MNNDARARLSAMRLQRDMDRLRTALRIRDKAARNLALRDYYTQIPSLHYEIGLIIFNSATSVAFAVWIAHSFALRPRLICFTPIALVIAFFIADVFISIFHKWFDCYAGEAHPLWGTGARAFRVHHEFPNNLDELSLVQAMAPPAPLMTLCNAGFLIAVLALQPGPLSCLTVWVIIQLLSIGNEIHKHAHLSKPNAVMRVLQRSGFFLSRSVHLKHHRGLRDRDYGIINGWSNTLFNWLDLWNRLDLFLWTHYHLFPRNWIQEPRSIPPGVLEELKADPSLIPKELLIYREALPDRSAKSSAELVSARAPAHFA